MFASLAAKLIPYKTIILVGIIIITLGSGWLYVHNLKSNNAQLTIDNTTLIENNAILTSERDKWVNAMEEQKVFTDTLAKDKIKSDKSTADLRSRLNDIRGKVGILNARNSVLEDAAKVVGETIDGETVKPVTISEVTDTLILEYSNSFNCISNASGHEVGCNE